MKPLRKVLLRNFILLSIIPLTLAIVAAFIIVKNQIDKKIYNRLESSSTGINQELDNLGKKLILISDFISDRDKEKLFHSIDSEDTFQHFQEDAVFFKLSELNVYNLKGRPLITNHPDIHHKHQLNAKTVNMILEKKQVLLVKEQLSKIGFINYQLLEKKGHKPLILELGILPEYSFLMELKKKYAVDIVVFNNNRLNMTTITDPEILNSNKLKKLNKKLIQCGQNQFLKGQFGKQFLYLLGHPISNKDKEILGSYILCLSNTNTENAIQSYGYAFLFFSLALFFIIFIVSKKLTLRITEPIHELNQHIELVSKGNFSHSLNVESYIEIHQLVKHFNFMNQELSETMITKNQLEREVDSRTKQISNQRDNLDILISNMPGAVYRCTNDGNWSILYMSEKIKSITGYPAESFSKNEISLSSLYHHDDTHLSDYNEKIKTEESRFISEYRINHRNDSIRWILEFGQAQKDSEGNIKWIDGLIFDNTEKKLAELELIQTKEALEEANLGLSASNEELDATNEELISTNQELDRTVTELEYSNLKINKSLKLIHERNFEVEKQKKELDILIENIPGAVYRCVNDEYWTMMYISDYVETITGYPSKTFISNKEISFSELYHKDDIKDLSNKVSEALNKKEPYKLEYRIFDKKGRIRWILEYGKAYYDGNGEVVWLDGIIYDNTDRKLIENEVLETKAELEDVNMSLQASNEELDATNEELLSTNQELDMLNKELEETNLKLKEYIEKEKEITQLKDEFTNNVNHELRTPLTSIILTSEFLIENSGELDAETVAKKAARIKKSSKNLLNLINELLDYSKLESNKMSVHIEKINIFDLISNLKDSFLELYENKGINLKFDVDYKIELHNDKEHLSKILNNLLSNAYKFTEKGEVEFQTISNEDKVIFTVKDTGVGISEEEQDYIFKRYRQGKIRNTKAPGTGLGLSIVKQLTEKHGGEVHLESESGKGSAFKIILPKKSIWSD